MSLLSAYELAMLEQRLKTFMDRRFDQVMRAILTGEWSEIQMNKQLTDVVQGIAPRLTQIDTTLGAVQEFMSGGIQKIVAAAVAKALADNDVDETAAAATVNAAVTDVEEHLQPIIDAMKANTPDADEPAPVTTGGDTTTGDTSQGGGSADDTLAGGSGDDTVSEGEGSTQGDGESEDTLLGGQGDDSIDAGGGSADSTNGGNGPDTVQGEAGDESLGGGQGDDTVNES